MKKEDEDDEMGEVVEDLREELLGIRCRVPWERSNHLHNAIVLDVGEGWDGEDIGSLPVQVVFSNPIQASMRPCQHFLKSNCTFTGRCKFSHGFTVRFDQLEEYKEPDYG